MLLVQCGDLEEGLCGFDFHGCGPPALTIAENVSNSERMRCSSVDDGLVDKGIWPNPQLPDENLRLETDLLLG